MRASLVFAILAMGMVGVVLAVITGEVYRDLALDSQRNSLAEIIELEVSEKLADVKVMTNKLSLSVQASEGFRKAFKAGNQTWLETELAQHFRRFFVTTSTLDVEKFIAYDKQLNQLAISSEVSSTLVRDQVPCPALVEEAAARRGAEKLKPISRLCLVDDRLFMSTVVPIGGLRLIGYLQMVVDPVLNLKAAEEDLGLPLFIQQVNHQTVYQSPAWPNDDLSDETAIVEYNVKDEQGNPRLFISFAFDISQLQQQLESTRKYIFLGAGLITLMATFLFLFILQKTALGPMSQLTQHLRQVMQDKKHLGKQVIASGNKEVYELATDFNAVTSELRDVYQALEKMAFTDSLTNLPNRDLFYDRLNQLILLNRRQPEPPPFAVFMMDLDRFKFINDTLGHHIGDLVLQQAGERVNAAVRESDTIARLGGDEFAALLPRIIDTQGAIIVAERIVKSLSEPFIVEGHSLQVGVSIGIVLHPYHSDDQNELVQRADVAMYYAKHNQLGFCFYETEIDQHNVLELTLETELKHAIENDHLQLFYQPKITIENGVVYGVEALLRWIHPERGFIPPDSFIPMAEQTGLIHPLTLWVMRQAVHQAKQWQDQGIYLNVAINLSAQSLRDPGFVTAVENVLDEMGLAPEYLTLELTESAVMSDPKRALEILNELDQKGVMLSIDDFGTGYSSLAYLKRLPVDEIKIDRSFVMEMDADHNDEVIVHSTIDLAHNMGLKVVAEGVETEQSWLTLKILGCDMGQGYHMCKPIDADSFIEWLESSSWTVSHSAKPSG